MLPSYDRQWGFVGLDAHALSVRFGHMVKDVHVAYNRMNDMPEH